jgi:protein TonB
VLDTLKVEAPPTPPSPDDERIDKIISGGVLNGRALKKPHPEYPPGAKMARVSGVVVVQITVDEKGDVVLAQAISGHPLLRKAGEDAARRAKFSPTTFCGNPMAVTGFVTYSFHLM